MKATQIITQTQLQTAIQTSESAIANGKPANEAGADGLPPPSQKKNPPQGTFEKTNFNQLLSQYDLRQKVPPTLETTQAFLLTQNMKETAARVNGLTAGGSSYHWKNDFVGDSARLVEQMQSVCRLIGNLGTSDKASNFLIEQRNLMKAQSQENKEIRDLIQERVSKFCSSFGSNLKKLGD